MDKRTYQIVDSETGRVVAEERIGGIRRFLYQIIASGWHKRLRWVIWGSLLFCVAAAIFEPLLQREFPTFYHYACEFIFAGLIIVFCRIVLVAGGEKRTKSACAKESTKKKYQVVDAETGKVVDTRDWEKTSPDRNDPAARRENLWFRITLALFALSGLSAIACIAVPNEWKGFAALLFLVSFVAHGVLLRIKK